MSQSDYYALLGVERSATVKDLRRAFRRLARKFHPDINPGDRAAEVHYQRICEAFEVLSAPESRDRYDRLGEEPKEEPEVQVASYGFEGFDFSISSRHDTDIFPEIFRRQKARRSRNVFVSRRCAPLKPRSVILCSTIIAASSQRSRKAILRQVSHFRACPAAQRLSSREASPKSALSCAFSKRLQSITTSVLLAFLRD